MIKYLTKDHIWQHEQTNYWFDVDGDQYAIADQNGNLSLLDSEGYPIDPCNDHDNVFDQLKPLYVGHIND